MNCIEAVKYLQEYLDRELTAENLEELEKHIRACGHCFGHFEFDKALKLVIQSKGAGQTLSIEFKETLRKKLGRLD